MAPKTRESRLSPAFPEWKSAAEISIRRAFYTNLEMVELDDFLAYLESRITDVEIRNAVLSFWLVSKQALSASLLDQVLYATLNPLKPYPEGLLHGNFYYPNPFALNFTLWV